MFQWLGSSYCKFLPFPNLCSLLALRRQHYPGFAAASGLSHTLETVRALAKPAQRTLRSQAPLGFGVDM